MPNYRLNIDKRVLRLLGAQLYGDTPSIISELVQNSCDADANNVWITIITRDGERIIVEDDGIGMTPDDINNRFLNIGYDRRDQAPVSPSGRKVLGRKGIGKLAVFSLARVVDVYSQKDGQKAGCRLDFDDITLRNADPITIQDEQISLNPQHLSPNNTGTKIVLSSMLKSISRSYSYVINRIVRSFDVNYENFKIFIRKNNEQFLELSRSELDYSKYMDTIVTLGEEFSNLLEKVISNDIRPEYKYTAKYDDLHAERGQIQYQQMPYQIYVLNKVGARTPIQYQIKGWIGTVHERDDFQKFIKVVDNETGDQTKFEVSVSDNRISIFSRNKMGEFDILSKVQTNRLMDAYIVGEIYADIFEEDDLADMSISNRRGYDEADPRYVQLIDIVSKLVRLLTRKKSEINALRRNDIEIAAANEEGKRIKEALYKKAPRTKKILEDKLDKPELEVLEDDMMQFARAINVTNATKKIFISHQSSCVEYGKYLVRIFELAGINVAETIIFTAMQGLGVPHSMDIYDYLKECFRDDLYVIFLFSKSFYNSNVCIAETGAAWATNKRYSNVVIDIGYNDIDNPCNRNRRGVNLNDLAAADFSQIMKEMFITILREIGFEQLCDEQRIEQCITQATTEYAGKLNGLIYIPSRRFLASPICSMCNNPMRLEYDNGRLTYKCSSRSCTNCFDAEIM